MQPILCVGANFVGRDICNMQPSFSLFFPHCIENFGLLKKTENVCQLPDPIDPGYVLPSTGKCSGLVKIAGCTGLKCMKGWSGTPKLSCPRNMSDFVLTGCYRTIVSLPPSLSTTWKRHAVRTQDRVLSEIFMRPSL